MFDRDLNDLQDLWFSSYAIFRLKTIWSDCVDLNTARSICFWWITPIKSMIWSPQKYLISRWHHAVIWVNPFSPFSQGKSLQSPLQTRDWRAWNSVRVHDTKVTNSWNYLESPLKKPTDQDNLSSAAGDLCSIGHRKTGVYISSKLLNNQAIICNHAAEGRRGVNGTGKQNSFSMPEPCSGDIQEKCWKLI